MPTFNLLYTALIIGGVVAVVLGTVAYLILAERKVAAWVQDRIGPNRVGPWGLLQPIVDGGKMFLKEEVTLTQVAKEPGLTLRTAERWAMRHRRHGLIGLCRREYAGKGKRWLSHDLQQAMEGLTL